MALQHPSIAGSQGSGSTLILSFVIIALWLSITKRFASVKQVIRDPVYTSGTPSTPGGATGTVPYIPKGPGGIGTTPIPGDWVPPPGTKLQLNPMDYLNGIFDL